MLILKKSEEKGGRGLVPAIPANHNGPVVYGYDDVLFMLLQI